LKDPKFQSTNNRLDCCEIQYGTGDAAGAIKKITMQ